jgi:hypothetical protein
MSPDELKQQILDAYGFDDWTPEERAVFDAWGRVEDALKAEREAFAASIPARANAIAPHLPELIAAKFPELADGIAALVEAGITFEWRTDG